MPEKINILGTKLDIFNEKDFLKIFSQLIGLKNGFACHLNVHTVMTAFFNETYRQAINSSQISFMDGMPLVWFAKLSGLKCERVKGPHLMREIINSDQKLKHYFLGSSDAVLNKIKEKVLLTNPKFQWAGHYSPPFMKEFSDEENQKMIKEIHESKADVVWIGLGAPKQELWAAKHCKNINALLVANGAAFNFYAGTIKEAPEWMQKIGLEWLFRLLSEPKRLWKRYLYNPLFVVLAVLQLLKIIKPKPI